MNTLMIRKGSVPPTRGWIGDLDWSLNWWVNPDHHYMAMLGYFDESGTHARSPVVIVGGFLASVGQWDAFQRDLKALLSEYGVQKFHAIELRRTEGDFKGWTRVQKGKFNSRFLQLADQHLTRGISTVLSSEAYRRVYCAGNVIRAAGSDSQYGLCVRVALWNAFLFMKDRKADWPLNLIFEDRNGHNGDADRVFSEVRDSTLPPYEGLFGSITFAPKTALPLAVADSLSYALFRQSAGSTQHPADPDAVIVEDCDPPYYVH